MSLAPTTWWILAGWVLLVGGYAAVSLVASPGPKLTAFGDIMQCIAPLYANAGLLLNAASPYRRRNAFWILLALGCSMWLIAQLLWTYFEVGLHQPVPNPFVGDVIIFLHIVPMIGALALQPHSRKVGEKLRYGYLDLLLLMLWWLYLYAFIVIPHQYFWPNEAQYVKSFVVLYAFENMILVVGLGVLLLRTGGAWRWIYANLFLAAFVYIVGAQAANIAIGRDVYHTGSLYDIPLIASFVWFGTAGALAHRSNPTPQTAADPLRTNGQTAARLAMIGLLSMPALASWSVFLSTAPEPVREFRLLITLGATALGTALVFWRAHLFDHDRLRLLRESQESLENLKRLQSQFVQSEKLAALGQLAAGAAHEINNPLTAILGYCDLLIEDRSLGEKQRTLAEKARDQARRTKSLVHSLLSFARQVPAEKTILDLNSMVTSALQLRTLDLRGKNIRIELDSETVLPAVRGDGNLLLQVFYHVIRNAVDAMQEVGGGVLKVRTRRAGANIVIEFCDTGPGIRDPHLVFDPFYTTKPVGKGTGLGLSICYGIIQEHGGTVTCFNRPEGGACFRIELPAVLAPFPRPVGAPPPPIKVG